MPPPRAVKRSTQTLLDQMLSRDTRAQALEKAIIANALIDPIALSQIGGIRVSDAAAYILTHIFEKPLEARAALVSTLDVALRFDSALGESQPRVAVLELARNVEGISIADLASCGFLVDLVTLLNSCRNDERIRQAAA